MSLSIDTDRVTAVLLADGRHTVKDSTFDLDSYEYRWGELRLLSGGQCPHVTSTGFTFSDDTGSRLYGPVTSILAVRTRHDGDGTP